MIKGQYAIMVLSVAGVAAMVLITKKKKKRPKARYCEDPNAVDSIVRRAVSSFLKTTRKVHCVIDFDHTLTSSDSAQCHDHLALIDDDLMQTEMRKYLDFSNGGHPDVRDKPIEAWWNSVHSLIIKQRITWTKLKDALAKTPIKMRPGAEHALSALLALKIPVTIVSAGLEHVIDLVLRPWFKILSLDDPFSNSVDTPFSLHLVANRILFNHDEVAAHVRPHPPVTAANKHCIYARLQSFFDSISSSRSRVLLIGDSVGDIQAVANIPHTQSLKIGFFNPDNPWAKREAFDAAFDFVIPHTASFDWLDLELRSLLGPIHFTPPSSPSS